METFTRKAAVVFARQLLAEARAISLPIPSMTVDHLCFRTDTIATYQEILRGLSHGLFPDLSGHMLAVASVNGRPIATWRLDTPIGVDGQLIECVEIPAPKPGKLHETGWEHAEALSFTDLGTLGREFQQQGLEVALSEKSLNTELAVKLRHGTVKFHHLPLSCVIACEESPIFLAAHRHGDLMAALHAWHPLPSGDSLIGTPDRDADLDVLLFVPEALKNTENIAQICRKTTLLDVSVEVRPETDSANVIVRADAGNMRLRLRDVPTYDQHEHRHLVDAWRSRVSQGAI